MFKNTGNTSGDNSNQKAQKKAEEIKNKLSNMELEEAADYLITRARTTAYNQLKLRLADLPRHTKQSQEAQIKYEEVEPLRIYMRMLYEADKTEKREEFKCYRKLKDYIFKQSKMFTEPTLWKTDLQGARVDVQRISDDILWILCPQDKRYAETKYILGLFARTELGKSMPNWKIGENKEHQINPALEPFLKEVEKRAREILYNLDLEINQTSNAVKASQNQEYYRYILSSAINAVFFVRERVLGNTALQQVPKKALETEKGTTLDLTYLSEREEKNKDKEVSRAGLKLKLEHEIAEYNEKLEKYQEQVFALSKKINSDKCKKASSELIDKRIPDLIKLIDRKTKQHSSLLSEELREKTQEKAARSVSKNKQQLLEQELANTKNDLARSVRKYQELVSQRNLESLKEAGILLNSTITPLENEAKRIAKLIQDQDKLKIEQTLKDPKLLRAQAGELCATDSAKAISLLKEAEKIEKLESQLKPTHKALPPTTPVLIDPPKQETIEEILDQEETTEEVIYEDKDIDALIESSDSEMAEPEISAPDDEDKVTEAEELADTILAEEAEETVVEETVVIDEEDEQSENPILVEPEPEPVKAAHIAKAPAISAPAIFSDNLLGVSPAVSIPQAQPATPIDIREAETIRQLRQCCLDAKYLGFTGKIETYIKKNFIDKYDVDEKIPHGERADMFDWLRLGDYIV